MQALKKHSRELALVTYWAFNLANTVFVSKKIGYYPKTVRDHAQVQANLEPYPWHEIYFSWFLITAFVAGAYFIIVKSRENRRACANLIYYSVAATFIYMLVTPSDTGGVTYAIFECGASLFIISAACLMFSYVIQGAKRAFAL